MYHFEPADNTNQICHKIKKMKTLQPYVSVNLYSALDQYFWDRQEPNEDNACAVIQASNGKWATSKCDNAKPVICTKTVTRK